MIDALYRTGLGRTAWHRAAALAVLISVGMSPAAAQQPDACAAPAPNAEPGTSAWFTRDAQNMACAEQRLQDTAANPIVNPNPPYVARDTLREPARHAGKRFRFDATVVKNRAGADMEVDIFRPCTAATCTDVPPGLAIADGPYPTVLIVHGGASNRQLHWWAAQALAESGYMAVGFDVAENTGGDHGTDAQDMMDWLHSDAFPFGSDLRRDRVGITGHSQGASTASLLAQIDPRIRAFVAWDNLTAIKEGWQDNIGVEPPADVVIRVPGLGIGADYYFVPRPYTAPPEPATSNGEGGRGRGFSAHPKDLGYQELRAAGVDTMLFILRAGTHLDFTPMTAAPMSRYGEAVSMYLTIAWFDRYLRGLDDPLIAADAHRRLVATVFDDSADVHAISTGRFDPTQGNQPYRIAGMSACDRMSFYFKSRIALRAPDGSRVDSEDLRSACLAGGVAPDARSGSSSTTTGGGALGGILLFALGLLAVLRRAARRGSIAG